MKISVSRYKNKQKREYPVMEFWEVQLQKLYLAASIDCLPQVYPLSSFLT